MGKLDATYDDIFTLFGANEWVNQSIATYPQNFVASDGVDEFIRINVVMGPGINIGSTRGILKVEIYTPAGTSIDRAVAIAEALNNYLENKTYGQTQFTDAALVHVPEKDEDKNPTFHKSIYSLNFNYFGVI